MADCFFGLLRNYIRVDDVIVRIYDTRIYHEFKDNFMIREFQVIFFILIGKGKFLLRVN